MKIKRRPVAVFLLSLFLFTGCGMGDAIYWEEIKSFFTGAYTTDQDNALPTGPMEDAATPQKEELPPSVQLPVEDILQLPELPNGCEATSLTMLLQYLGLPADKIDIVENYLPRADVVLQNGLPYGPDPNDSYVGNPADTTGYYCFAQPIVTAANQYLADSKSSLQAQNITGADSQALMQQLADGHPVVVWCTKEFAPLEDSINYWYLNATDELYVPYSNLHCMVLCGYDDEYFYLRDPLNNELAGVEQQVFLDSYAALNQQAVVIHDPTPVLNLGRSVV